MNRKPVSIQNQLLDLIATMNQCETDYQLAKYLGIPLQSIRNYRQDKSKMSTTMCLVVANELHMDPLQVMARVKMQGKISTRDKELWSRYLGRDYHWNLRVRQRRGN